VPLLWHLRFDADPLHLKNPTSESMQALRVLAQDPDTGMNHVNVLAGSLAQAQHIAQQLSALPQVGQAMTLASFIPADQTQKLPLIHAAASELLPVLQQPSAVAATDSQRVSALRAAALALRNAALDHPGSGAAQAQRLSTDLVKLAKADTTTRDRAEQAFASTLQLALRSLHDMLLPQTITRQNLPPQLVRDWVAANGQALVDVTPKSMVGKEPGDETVLHNFIQAVQRIAPHATGGPISIRASAETIIHAFIEAAVLSIVVITLLLWGALKRLSDVLRTIVPLLVSGLVTLELCVLFGISLNFANIIALPLLLGIGVAFKIYYVIAWRNGKTAVLQSGLTQAVILSAATTGTAFGSLWFSHHPGTASMGELLALSLLCTLIGAVLFQPVLMGKPRAAPSADS
jgi:hopanoid biosynthesis associated RND transporter like protein HpnN